LGCSLDGGVPRRYLFGQEQAGRAIVKHSIAAAALLMCAAGNAAAADHIKIGLMTAFSGPLGVTGAEVQRGAELALLELGGKLGGLPATIVPMDDQTNPSIAVANASKLIDQEHVDFVTGLTPSNVLLAVAQPYIEAKTFMIGALAGPSQLAGKQCNPYVFVVSFQNDEWDEALGNYMNDKGMKRVFFMGMDYQAGWDHVAGARRTFKGTAAGQIFTPLSQLDFAAELAQVREAKPDAVFVLYAGALAVAYVKQYAQAGLQGQIPLLATDALSNELTFAAQGDAALGITLATSWSYDLDNAANKRFVASFVAKYGRRPTLFSAFQYDAMMLMDAAVRDVGGKIEDKDALHAALRKADFHSVRGDFKFNNNQFPIQNIYVEHVVKDTEGQLKLALSGQIAEAYQDSYHQECPMK
jgi:branched-chain amino acid transport system substrate-binding protein